MGERGGQQGRRAECTSTPASTEARRSQKGLARAAGLQGNAATGHGGWNRGAEVGQKRQDHITAERSREKALSSQEIRKELIAARAKWR